MKSENEGIISASFTYRFSLSIMISNRVLNSSMVISFVDVYRIISASFMIYRFEKYTLFIYK